MTAADVKIGYCDGPRLRRALLAASDHVAARQDELNRINVFPVADGDTGTNLALTLRSVADAVRPLESGSVSKVARRAARASVQGARGNSGMILSHFLLAFAENLGPRVRAELADVAEALYRAGVDLAGVLEAPVEGTILTVARAAAVEARCCAERRRDLYDWLRDVREAARASLAETRRMLPQLRDADVVDAGAKGFVAMIEGTLRYIEGRPLSDPSDPARKEEGEDSRSWRPTGEAVDGEGRYCTQISLEGEVLPGSDRIRSALHGLGTSLIVIRSRDLARVHIHADDPKAVEARISEIATVSSFRTEDTRNATRSRRVALVTDSSADLPRAWARENGVEIVPLRLVVGDRTYRDGVEVGSDELLRRLRAGKGPRPTTSQPPPGAFLEGYRQALGDDRSQLLGVFLSGAVSGTFGSARTAARELREAEWKLVDSRSGSLGLGMLVIRAAELLDRGWSLKEVADELDRIRDRSNILFTVESLEGLLRSGRVGRARAWLSGLLDLRPLLRLDADGNVVPAGRVRGRDGAVDAVLDTLDTALDGARRYRIGIAHAGVPDFAGDLEREIARRYRPVAIHTHSLTPVLGVHLGPGAWGVCYQIED